MIFPLKEICIKQIAKDILNEKTTNTHQKLDVGSSNQVLREFLKLSNKERFSESCQHVKNLLTVTEISLDTDECDENVCKMIYDQNLDALLLFYIMGWKMFHLEVEDSLKKEDQVASTETNGPEEDQKTTVCRVDVITVLEKMLNPDSRKKLRGLTIGGLCLELVPGWVEKLAVLLPSLINLQLYYLASDSTVIQSIYNNFPNLTMLQISGAKISNLNGISNLQKLSYLIVSGIEFGGKDDMKELFELRNLTALDMDGEIGSERRLKNWVYYLECDQILPELTDIDCSGCEITEAMLQKLVDTHQKLEAIVLMQTSLENRPQLKIPGRNLHLVTMGSFRDCLRTIEFYGGCDSPPEHLAPVFLKMKEMLDEQYEEISQQELRDCLKMTCEIAGALWEAQEPALQVLEEICRDTRASVFTFDERQDLIYSLLQTIHKSYEKSPYTSLVSRISIWKVLGNPVIFNTSLDNIDQLCEEAAEGYYRFIGYENWSRVECAKILCDYMEKMSIERGKALAQNKDLWGNTMTLMDEDNRANLFFYVKLIQNIYIMKDDRSDEMDEQCLQVLLKSIIVVHDDDAFKTLVVETVKIVIGYMSYDVVKNTLDRPWYLELYLKMLYSNNKEAQQFATAFILLFLFPHPKPSLENFVKNIRKALEGFEYDEETENDLIGLKWIQINCNDKMTKNFCKLMIKKVEKEVVELLDSEESRLNSTRHFAIQ